MISERKLRRFQFGLLLGAAALFGFYWFAYRSLSAWARDLDQPTTAVWKRLIATAQTNAHVRALDPATLQAAVQQMRQAAVTMQQAADAVRARISLDADTAALMGQEFQLLEYDRQRLRVRAELQAAAAQQKVLLTAAALDGLPEFAPELARPQLLWAQLALARQLVATALAAQPRAVSNLTMLPTLTHGPVDGRSPALHQFRMRLELIGPAASAVQFLRSLPLLEGELAAAGLPAIAGKTQPFFLDRLILKNVSANPDETSLEAVLTAFCVPPESEVTP